MTDKLLSNNGTANVCIVAAVADLNSNHSIELSNKLKNCSNGSNINSIHLKNSNGAFTKTTKFDSINNVNDLNGGSNEPPDGGARALCVMISAFLCNSIIFGIINTYGTIYEEINRHLERTNDAEASSKAALVGSLAIGTTFFLSPVSGILTDRIGLRLTTFIGGVLTVGGMLLSSLVCTNITLLYLTYGIMFGCGAALAYTPTLAILGHYFKRYLGIVSGFVTCGSSLFTVILPKALELLLAKYGLQGTFFLLGSSAMIVIVCALIYKPLQKPPPPPIRKPGQTTCNMHIRSLINLENFKRKRYVVWSLSIPVALIGYFVPYVHMAKYVKETYPGEEASYPIMCIGFASGIGRLFFGYIADYKCIDRILLQQISFAIMGILTILIPLVDSYYVLIIISLGMGIVDGCFISLLGPVAYDLCGPHGAAQGIGFLLGLTSIPLTAGAPIAGFLYDQTKSYRMSFIVAGIPALIGAALMTLIRCMRDERIDVCDKEHNDQFNKLLNKPAWTEDINPDDIVKSCNTYTFQKENGETQPKQNGTSTITIIDDKTEFQIDEHQESRL